MAGEGAVIALPPLCNGAHYAAAITWSGSMISLVIRQELQQLNYYLLAAACQGEEGQLLV